MPSNSGPLFNAAGRRVATAENRQKMTMVSREEGLLYISLSIMNLGALINAWRNGEDRNMLSASVASAA